MLNLLETLANEPSKNAKLELLKGVSKCLQQPQEDGIDSSLTLHVKLHILVFW